MRACKLFLKSPVALRFLLPLFLFGCAGPQSSQLHKNEPPSPIEKRLDEPERVIHCGDLIKITIKFPGRALGSLEAVQKDGDVATPEGSFIKANAETIIMSKKTGQLSA